MKEVVCLLGCKCYVGSW